MLNGVNFKSLSILTSFVSSLAEFSLIGEGLSFLSGEFYCLIVVFADQKLTELGLNDKFLESVFFVPIEVYNFIS